MQPNLWDKDETSFLEKNYGSMHADELAKALGRSPMAVKIKMCRMGLRVSNKKPWTAAEERYLERNADKMMAKHIALYLGRSTSSVLSKGRYMGIPFTSVKRRHSDEDVALCIALHKDGMPVKLIAEKMEISIQTLESFLPRNDRNVAPAQ